jgi:hypothetical protein
MVVWEGELLGTVEVQAPPAQGKVLKLETLRVRVTLIDLLF